MKQQLSFVHEFFLGKQLFYALQYVLLLYSTFKPLFLNVIQLNSIIRKNYITGHLYFHFFPLHIKLWRKKIIKNSPNHEDLTHLIHYQALTLLVIQQPKIINIQIQFLFKIIRKTVILNNIFSISFANPLPFCYVIEIATDRRKSTPNSAKHQK